MTISKTCSYGLWAVIYMASLPEGEYVSIRKISKELGVSFHFLTKILQKLTDEKILNSLRGTNGGVALARKKSDINLLEVIRAIDGHNVWSGCYLGLPGCSDEEPCPMHDHWKEQRTKLKEYLSSKNLEELSGSIDIIKSKLQDEVS